MCGIVGFIENSYNINSLDIDLFENLLIVDSLRGLDSTGAFSIYGKSGSVAWIKQATNPLNMLKTPEWDKFTKKAIQSAGILVGHNRKATQGGINTDNAHPFIVGDTILIHNGGISNFRKFDSTKSVDSHAVCAAIDKEGHQVIIPELEGAWVLVWYNMKTKRLYFHRNSQRPLFWAQTQHHQIFASELEFILLSASRNNVKINKKWEFATNTLSEYDVMSKKWYSTELKSSPKTVVTYYNNKWSGYGGLDDGMVAWMGGEAIGQDGIPPPSTVTPPWVNDEDKPNTSPKASSIMLGFDDEVDITVDQVISLRIDSLRKDEANGKIKVTGKCISPHLPYCDVCGYVEATSLENAHILYPADGVYQATVKSVGNHVCGPVLWVEKIEDAEYIQDYTGTKWAANTVRFLVLEGLGCSTCAKKEIGMESIPFSIIKRQVHVKGTGNTNKYKIQCPDCVSKTLTGKDKDDFETRYLAALQDGEQVDQKIAEQTH